MFFNANLLQIPFLLNLLIKLIRRMDIVILCDAIYKLIHQEFIWGNEIYVVSRPVST